MRRAVVVAAALLLLLPLAASADMFPDASNAVLPAALDNLGKGGQLAASPLCTTTNGSAAITACNSTSGITPGMIVNGAGITPGTTVQGGVTATGFTLSAPATASAVGSMVHLRPSFWSSVDGSPPSMIRVPGRLMVGNAVGRSDTRSGTPNTNFDFCPETRFCAQWAPRDSQLAVMSQNGNSAITGMTKASMGAGLAGGIGPIALGGYVINDLTTNNSAWGNFIHATSENPSPGHTWAIEIGLKNKGYNGTTTSYTEQGGMTGIAIRGGSDESFGGASTAPSNTAIYIAHGGSALPQTFNKGIVFEANALVGNDGLTGLSTAIEMGRGQLVKWIAPNNTTAAYMTSEVSGSTTQKSILMDDGYIAFRGQATQHIFRMTDSTGGVPGNYFRSYAAAPGSFPNLAAEGAGSDIDILMSPKGTGVLHVTKPIRTAGYTVATLPAGQVGMRAYVTDQLTTCAAIGAALTGGGAKKCPVFHDGTAWVGG